MQKPKRPALPLDASPQEKYDNLILTFFEEWQIPIGKWIICGAFLDNSAPNHFGFQDIDEVLVYFEALIENNFLEERENRIWWGNMVRYKIPHSLRITFNGIQYCLLLKESGKNSTRCFVAMKFSQDMEPFYQKGIVKAIKDNKFRPIRVDKEHAENEQTINDFIIASIKQSRFCVADLTHKSHGAYFEAGYALGRGLKVIYTCREDHFEDIHFDLKSMQIIRYSTPEELREALSLKIQAFI